MVDAGPLYAYVDADDAHHEESLDFLRLHPGPLVVPVPVIAEVAHLVGTRLGAGAEVRFLADLASGAFSIEPSTPATGSGSRNSSRGIAICRWARSTPRS